MRILYTILYSVLLPLMVLRLLWRSRKAPAYRRRIAERFGRFPHAANIRSSVIWLHTVSVGETIASRPLVYALLARYPSHQLVITTMTPTGSAQVLSSFAQDIAAGRILHSYMPYDLPVFIRGFIGAIRPRLAIFMETEVWPNVLHVCQHNGVATSLINARLSAKSLRGYQKLPTLSRQMFSSISHIAAQSPADAERIAKLGGERITVTGNIKSEINVDDALAAQAQVLQQSWVGANNKTIIIAASTHPGEDDIILSAFKTLLDSHPHLLLVIVPRHPERFGPVASLCQQQGFVTALRSQTKTQVQSLSDNTQVLVGDTMGEMMLLLGASHIAIICGSFIEHGGHNMLEPAAWGLPIISGSSVYNFAKIADDLVAQQGLLLVDGQESLQDSLDRLLSDPNYARTLGEQAKQYVMQSKGALDNTLQVIDQPLAQ